jgi:hypothetical protein
MPWNHWTDRLPTEQELEEPDVLLNRLLEWSLRQENRAEARWLVQALADSLGVPITMLPQDATDRANDLGDAWVTAVQIAGRDIDERAGVSITALGKVRELRAVLDEWRDQGDQTDAVAILERGWNSPMVPRRSGH